MALISVVYYILWALNIFLIFRKKENQFVVFFTWVLLYFLFASNSAISGDAYKYKLDYEQGSFGTSWSEAGNVLIKLMCKSIGLHSYNQYLIVLFAIASALLFLGVRKLKGNWHVIFATAMVFIFPAMAAAIRFFLAFSLFVFCLDYLLKGERIKCVAGILIAATFHRSALFFLIFVLSEVVDSFRANDSNRKKVGYVVGAIAICCAAYTLIVRKLPFVSVISSLILRFFPDTNMKVDVYFGSFTRFGFLIMFFVYIANFLLSRYMISSVRSGQYADKIIIRSESFGHSINKLTAALLPLTIKYAMNTTYPGQSNEDIKRLASFGYTINILTAALLPLTVVNLVFFRLYAAQAFINCIVFTRVIVVRKPYHTGRIAISLADIWFLITITIIAWFIPAIFHINSISVNNMIMDSMFVR